jgi:hypothetical protein
MDEQVNEKAFSQPVNFPPIKLAEAETRLFHIRKLSGFS